MKESETRFNNQNNQKDKSEQEFNSDKLPEIKGGCYSVINTEIIKANEYGADYKVSTGYGVEFYTDSETLAKQIELVKNDHLEETTSDLIYITNKEISLPQSFQLSLKKPKAKAGNLFITSDLRHYAINGPEKFGSAVSIIYGISSFNKAEMGILGLHASQILDNKWNCSHLLIGTGRSGKTTYAQLLEKFYPKRFKVVADDWVELSIKSSQVNPISKSIGITPKTITEEIAETNLEKSKEYFRSFGKNFYLPGLSTEIPRDIGNIFQLHTGMVDPSDTGLIMLLRGFNYHIPFLSQTQNDTKILPPNVCSKLDAICANYIKIARKSNFHFINVDRDSNQVLGNIADNLR